MSRNYCADLVLLGALVLAGCQPTQPDTKPPATRHGAEPQRTRAEAAAYASTSPAADSPISRWEVLMPEEAKVLRPPPVIGSRGFGQPNALGGLIDDSGSGTPPGIVIDHSSPNRAQQFGSSEVVESMEGRQVSLDGYVVPLDSDDDGRVRELLFVPFYGACIHVPPPPPNQIIRVVLATPIAVPELWDPFHLSGRIHIARFDADVARASYEAQGASLEEIRG